MDIILDENFIEEVKAHNDIVDVISEICFLKKAVKIIKGYVHFTKKNSFLLYPRKSSFFIVLVAVNQECYYIYHENENLTS